MSEPTNPRLFEPWDTRGNERRVDEPFDPRHATEITLRDLFAAAALAGICANPELIQDAAIAPAQYRDAFADASYKQADAMLRERSKSDAR